MSRKYRIGTLFAAFAATLVTSQAATAVDAPEERHDNFEEIIITGSMRVGAGGAQDINFFRGEVQFARIPHPETFTAEGLLSEHNIVLPAATACAQLFCLTGEAANAALVAVPHAKYLAGVGFATNIDSDRWRRERVNIVAVVDKSGSMDGEPLDLVRMSLREVAEQLHAGDQMSIVLYGDRAHVHLRTIKVGVSGIDAILDSIDAIESYGSTSMEAGLRLGYEVAHETAPKFKGVTRLMLFTDERPNTDATDAESFMGLAIEGSHAGIGLTTIGVGVQFDAELATEVSSVRGGNLYFIRDEADVNNLFSGQLDYMVSELAYDLKLTLTPQEGYKIAGVYGVPGQLLGWQNDRNITVTIPTVFLDNHGGGVFFTLAREPADEFLPARPPASGEPLAHASVSYVARDGRPSSDELAIAMQPAGPSDGMALGSMLIDEFTALHEATTAHYVRNDQEAAYQLVSALQGRVNASEIPGIDGERELIAALHDRLAFLAGHGAEAQIDKPFAKLWGRWRVVGSEGGSRFERGETVEFSPDSNFRVYGEDNPGAAREEEEYQSNDKQVYLTDSELTFNYRISEMNLSLRQPRTGVRVQLVRDGAADEG